MGKPKVGTLADQLGKIRDKKRLADEQVKKFAEQYNAKEKELFNAMKDAKLEKASGKNYTASIGKATHASVTDWNKLYAYIKKNAAWDLLQRRVSGKAYRDRLENGKKVAGVEPFTKMSMSLKER